MLIYEFLLVSNIKTMALFSYRPSTFFNLQIIALSHWYCHLSHLCLLHIFNHHK
jgi:hypothetical protein